ncbi:MAG TPA: GntR family transcriptional regulator [Blastocatellia bacterium]|nr:GntR family transcriptional regulator [Blastocatellia bacterium]
MSNRTVEHTLPHDQGFASKMPHTGARYLIFINRTERKAPLRKQLIAQISFGIASHELKPGQKLWSAERLARSLGIHTNTVSNVYRDLAQQGWVKSRRGSGVYVSDVMFDDKPYAHQNPYLFCQPPKHFLVIEDDDELRRILVTEIKHATGRRAKGVSLEQCSNPAVLTQAIPVAMCYRTEQVRAALPPGEKWVKVCLRSGEEMFKESLLSLSEQLIAIVSTWPVFLDFGRDILVARGMDLDAITTYDAREGEWKERLRAYSLIISDSLASKELPSACSPLVFSLIAKESLAELDSIAKQFTPD